MRNFGAILFLLGILGFFYASSRVEELPPVPEGISLREGLEYPAGRWTLAQYAIATASAMGLILLLFPKGR